MWWCSAPSRRALLALPLALAACGFEPVYGPGGTGSALRNKVLVEGPGSVESFLLVEALEFRLGQPDTPLYRLDFESTIVQERQAVTPNNETTRYSVIGTLDYNLHPIGQPGEVLAGGRIESFTGYSATGTTVETFAAERDAQARLMELMADRLVGRLQATADLGS